VGANCQRYEREERVDRAIVDSVEIYRLRQKA